VSSSFSFLFISDSHTDEAKKLMLPIRIPVLCLMPKKERTLRISRLRMLGQSTLVRRQALFPVQLIRFLGYQTTADFERIHGWCDPVFHGCEEATICIFIVYSAFPFFNEIKGRHRSGGDSDPPARPPARQSTSRHCRAESDVSIRRRCISPDCRLGSTSGFSLYPSILVKSDRHAWGSARFDPEPPPFTT
jgi:hypothetical protein